MKKTLVVVGFVLLLGEAYLGLSGKASMGVQGAMLVGGVFALKFGLKKVEAPREHLHR